MRANFRNKHLRGKRQHGFSLLELVLVMVIMGVMASVSLTFIDEKDSQQRYQQSVEKLKMIQRFISSVHLYQGQLINSGFSADNGLNNDLISMLLGYTSADDYYVYSITPIFVNLDADDSSDANGSSKQIIVNSQLFKGSRPGLFDLSQYRDGEGKIKDSWGESFDIQALNNDTEFSVAISAASSTYKNVSNNFHQVNVAKPIYVNELFVTVNDLPDTTTRFKVALISFTNRTNCNGNNDEIKRCWQTLKSNVNTASSAPFNNLFKIVESSDENATFVDGTNKIQSISPEPSNINTQKMTELTFTDDANKQWRFNAVIPTQGTTFNFTAHTEAKITVGSHVVILLEEISPSSDTWQIYNAEAPISAYVNLLPGVSPEPIILSLL